MSGEYSSEFEDASSKPTSIQSSPTTPKSTGKGIDEILKELEELENAGRSEIGQGTFRPVDELLDECDSIAESLKSRRSHEPSPSLNLSYPTIPSISSRSPKKKTILKLSTLPSPLFDEVELPPIHKENHQLIKDKGELLQKTREKDDEIKKLREELRQVSSIREEFPKLQLHLQSVTGERDSLAAQLDTFRDNGEMKVKALEKQVKNLQDVLFRREGGVGGKERIGQLEGRIRELEAEQSKAESDAKAQLTKVSTSLSNLKGKYENRVAELEKHIAGKEKVEERNGVRKENANIMKLRSQLTEREKEAFRLKKEITELKKTNEGLQRERANYLRRGRTFATASAPESRTVSEVQRLRKEIEDLNIELGAARDEGEKLKKKIEEIPQFPLQVENREDPGCTARLKDEVKSLELANADLARKIALLEKPEGEVLAELMGKVEELRSRYCWREKQLETLLERLCPATTSSRKSSYSFSLYQPLSPSS